MHPSRGTDEQRRMVVPRQEPRGMKVPHFWGTTHCLVTGAGGFLGSHLVVELARRGARTIVGVVPNKAELVSLERRGLTDKMTVCFGDVADSALMEGIVARYDIDVCFHLGAVTQVRQGAFDPANTFDTNIRGTWSLLEACRRGRRTPCRWTPRRTL
jgi:CDP-glucose 4,6-dehydratase